MCDSQFPFIFVQTAHYHWQYLLIGPLVLQYTDIIFQPILVLTNYKDPNITSTNSLYCFLSIFHHFVPGLLKTTVCKYIVIMFWQVSSHIPLRIFETFQTLVFAEPFFHKYVVLVVCFIFQI